LFNTLQDQLQTCTGLYVEDQLSRHFPILVDYVKKAEQQQKRLAIPEGQVIPNFAPAQGSPILRDFAVRADECTLRDVLHMK
jgi:hypothetical protein